MDASLNHEDGGGSGIGWGSYEGAGFGVPLAIGPAWLTTAGYGNGVGYGEGSGKGHGDSRGLGSSGILNLGAL